MEFLTPTESSFLERERYLHIRTIATGDFGVVVSAKNHHKRFACKLLRRFDAFQREQFALTVLNPHPNIITYYGSWSDRSVFCIKTQYIRGRTLLDMLMEEPFSEAQTWLLFKQLVCGMMHAHQSGVVHRDLKAENIMISPDRQHLTIIDWTMAAEWSTDVFLTGSCGSPDYAAPELYQKQPYLGTEVDIWSMGVILYAMVTSSFPFSGSDPDEIASKVCNGVYPLPMVSLPLVQLIARMLTVKQSERITMKEILEHPWLAKDSVVQDHIHRRHHRHHRYHAQQTNSAPVCLQHD